MAKKCIIFLALPRLLLSHSLAHFCSLSPLVPPSLSHSFPSLQTMAAFDDALERMERLLRCPLWYHSIHLRSLTFLIDPPFYSTTTNVHLPQFRITTTMNSLTYTPSSSYSTHSSDELHSTYTVKECGHHFCQYVFLFILQVEGQILPFIFLSPSLPPFRTVGSNEYLFFVSSVQKVHLPSVRNRLCLPHLRYTSKGRQSGEESVL